MSAFPSLVIVTLSMQPRTHTAQMSLSQFRMTIGSPLLYFFGLFRFYVGCDHARLRPLS